MKLDVNLSNPNIDAERQVMLFNLKKDRIEFYFELVCVAVVVLGIVAAIVWLLCID